ncbi:right-handed parallel beta-helix repeat-containing protein [Aquihabitans daechungensis]|uniref:right-handed parallel beta-helix repeat-containing protein n=1 Tax=Aquihabitans daechungensis TaxID=1052257 RepID=UPI003B9E90A6
MSEQGEASAASPTRRTVLTGAAAALAGAGAGAAAAVLLDRNDPAPTPSLAAGSVPGGDGGPWHVVAPGGSIQETIDGGARAIQLGDGEYPVDAPIVPRPGCTIRGIGEGTVLTATTEIDAVIAIGAGGPIGGVTIADLVVAAGRLATTGIDLDIVGTRGNFQQEPDSVCRLDNLWVTDALQDGIVYRGTDTQACTTSRVRVRRAGRYGFRVEAPDNVWIACEATTTGADGAGFYVGEAIAGSDGIGAGNCHFHACKAWYCHGYGWLVATGRNTFVGCEAQDVAKHGWYITGPRSTYTGCVADTAGMGDVGGTPGTADGFYVEPASEISLVGCMAFDRSPGPLAEQQRYGFNVPKALVDDGLLVAPIGWGSTDGLINARG